MPHFGSSSLPDEELEARGVERGQLALADAAVEQRARLGDPVLPAVDVQASAVPAAAVLLGAYGVLVNLPFIAIQRYNRFRTQALLERVSRRRRTT